MTLLLQHIIQEQMIDTILIIKIQEEWVKEIRQEILPRPLSGEGKTSTRILKETVIYFGRILLVVESHQTPRGPSLSTRDHRATEVITGVGNQDHHPNIELNGDQFQTLEVAGT